MKTKIIQGQSAPERIVNQILKNLETGEMKPNDKLPTQEQLGEIFGVGRSSIREAMNALAIMGYLKITAGKGTFISKNLPTQSDTTSILRLFSASSNPLNLIKIREILECYAVEQAAKIAEDEDLALLKKAFNRLEKSDIEIENFLKEDLFFHVAITKAAKYPEIGKIIEMIHLSINKELVVSLTTSKTEKITLAINTARGVFHNIISGEGFKATRYMRNHLAIISDVARKL
jgi:GntR family transcriptional regulator, transcriptional repressor for pyruvate dehydrogenase complex